MANKNSKNAISSNLIGIAVLVAAIVIAAVIFSAIMKSSPQECPACVCERAPDCTPARAGCTTQTTEVLKYVCSDGSVVSSADLCVTEEIPQQLDLPEYDPVTINEASSSIQSFMVVPACVGQNGGYIDYDVKHLPKNVAVQIKDSPEKDYETVFTKTGVYSEYIYFVICDDCLSYSFQLKTNKRYLLRMMFNQTSLNKVEYSNEYVVDTSPGSGYMKKTC